jgi:hypothetical protein
MEQGIAGVQPSNLIGGGHKSGSMTTPSGMMRNLPNIKLAKIADSRGRKELADFLIQNEKSIVKKIPFLLEVKQYDRALIFAMEGGDPNIINKVLSEILKKRDSMTAI